MFDAFYYSLLRLRLERLAALTPKLKHLQTLHASAQ